MRATELIPVLANYLGVPVERAWVIDRSLADGGLRTKVKGRKPPPMTRREAIHFLIACMVETTATRAAESVEQWLQHRWMGWEIPRKYEDILPASIMAQGRTAEVGLIDYLMYMTSAFGSVLDESVTVKFEMLLLEDASKVSFSSSGKIQEELFFNRNKLDKLDFRGRLHRISYVYGGVFQLIAEHTDAPADASERTG